ncbi:MAG TPA: flagellar biosynthesis protein FlhB [Thiolapillus brandeum]|uniref:Flagellar biosynthetic protein FlhB n=1 Tax=Thiolapillus brandeum TaxID=1076588 RepID=A0A831WAM1_9GAMM|nr:flagellar biosynthesis protein FlhB [Thiolapillus brandeum]
MAEQDSGQERTEQPTAKKLADARKKGQIARSKELNTTLMLIIAALSFFMVGGYLGNELRIMMQSGLQIERGTLFTTSSMLEAFENNVFQGLKYIAPFLLITVVSAFIGPLVMGGWNFTLSSAKPKFNKLNPASGLKRMFGQQALVELLKSLAKVGLIGLVGTILLWGLADNFLLLSSEPVNQGIIHGGKMMLWEFLAFSTILLLVAGIDVPYQIWTHKKKLRMTRQDIKEEFKQTDGNPEVKGKVRALQREMAQKRMLEDVPEASVILINPTHFSVAIRYKDGQDHSPVVIAKGTDQMAFRIREVAEANSIPLFSAPPLTRALYYSTEIGQPIPTGLFVAVAKVLAYIYRINEQMASRQAPVQQPDDLDIPTEFLDLNRKNNKFER